MTKNSEKIMNIEQAVIEKLRLLPPEKQQEVLEFAESLQQKITSQYPRRSLKGLWADLSIDEITEEEIAQARQEMWGNFPREIL